MPWNGPYPLPPGEDTYRHWYDRNDPEGTAPDTGRLSAYLLIFDDATDLPALTARLAAEEATDLVLSPVPIGTHGAALVHASDAKAETLKTFANEIGFQVVAVGPPRAAGDFTVAADGETPAPGDAVFGSDAVITGVIDIGISPGLSRFRRAGGGTRIEYFWDMNPHGVTSAGVTQGREFSRPEIDTAIAGATRGGFLDDEAFLDALSLVDRGSRTKQVLGLSNSHGTKVMDLACGYGPDEHEIATKNPIIAVQLPTAVVEQTDGHDFRDVVLEALDHVIRRARDLSDRVNGTDGADLPLVINLSFGAFADRHDGDGAMERVLAERAALPAVSAIFVPAGNSFQSRTHGRLPAADVAAGDANLGWQLQPGSRAPGFLQMWLPDGTDGADLTLSVTPTHPHASGNFILSDAGTDGFWELVEGGAVRARVYKQTDLGGGAAAQARIKVTMAVQPTQDLDEGPRRVSPGTWTIGLSGPGLPEGAQVECWVERQDTLTGFPPRGRQSYLRDADYVRYDPLTGDWADAASDGASTVKRDGTISSFASGRGTIVAGSYRRRDLHPSIFSSADLPVGGGTPDVDMMAESEMSRARPSLLVAGNRGRSTAFARGTSSASALATRTAVAILMADPTQDVRSALQQLATDFEADNPDAPALTAERGGAGRLGAAFPGQERRYTA